MQNALWYLKQLFPFMYRSVYAEHPTLNGPKQIVYTTWRMWFGRCFSQEKVILSGVVSPPELVATVDKLLNPVETIFQVTFDVDRVQASIKDEWRELLLTRLVAGRAPTDMNNLLPALAAKLGLQDPSQYILEHGKGHTTRRVLIAIVLAESGYRVAYVSRQGLSKAYRDLAVRLVEADKCSMVSQEKLVFKSGGEILFLNYGGSMVGARLDEIIEDT
jgi:hypothetical protein